MIVHYDMPVQPILGELACCREICRRGIVESVNEIHEGGRLAVNRADDRTTSFCGCRFE